MILAFDVGNTETTVGLFAGTALRAHWRVNTDPSRTPDEIGMLIDGLLRTQKVKHDDVLGAVIGSVVPAVTGPLAEAPAAEPSADGSVPLADPSTGAPALVAPGAPIVATGMR